MSPIIFSRIKKAFKNSNSYAIISTVIITLFVGMVFYHKIEGWSYFDSLYFCVITLTTVGYGDFSPITTLGKLFTIFYVFIGLGILVSFIDVIAKEMLKKRERAIERLKKLKEEKLKEEEKIKKKKINKKIN